ncbi:NUDIX domain-containing protein [Patescibacteria group bacterium]|nr:NUDIX domain-containing protein [Patescibacteria group bacterium]
MTNTSMQIQQKLGQKRLFYATRDIERAEAGLLLGISNFWIITNNSPRAKILANEHKNIIIADDKKTLDTWQILQTPRARRSIKPGEYILVFKNTKQIETTCARNDWHLLNPKAELSSKIEEKISQIERLGPLTKYLPTFQIEICEKLKWKKKKFILQFNRAHTGSGTFLISSKKELDGVRKKFPKREARITKYIKGPFFTNNNIVWGDRILTGNINYQITGLKPFTDNPFATIGNDWELPHKILNKKKIAEYDKIALAAGKRLKKFGWKGLYGIDAVMDAKTKKIYLIEINARQPASATYESQLQNSVIARSEATKQSHTTFEAHLASLIGIPANKESLTKISTGAQIIQRVTTNTTVVSEPRIMKPDNLRYVYYNNTALNSDLLRIQTNVGVMAEHNKFNSEGGKIIDFIVCAKHGNPWNAPRAGTILIRDNKILLIKRYKFGKKYFAIPGGTLDNDKNMLALAKREILEETGLKFEPVSAEPIHVVSNGRDEYYFIGKNVRGESKLGGPEIEHTHPDNSYELKWIKLSDLKKNKFITQANEKNNL